jgi:P27 family predicted phage terminase small subunit
MRGRKPKPTALKLVQGNPGRRPLNASEPMPEPSLPPCPTHLSPAARREYGRLGRQLVNQGVMTALDRNALALYCEAWARHVDAEEHIATYGAVIMGAKGLVLSPYIRISSQCVEQLTKLQSEFGLTPTSRSRVHAAPKETVDPLSEYLNG